MTRRVLEKLCVEKVCVDFQVLVPIGISRNLLRETKDVQKEPGTKVGLLLCGCAPAVTRTSSRYCYVFLLSCLVVASGFRMCTVWGGRT